MPAWKNREAGRRGRKRNEPREGGFFDERSPRDSRSARERDREHPASRAERLTRTATSLGNRQALYDRDAMESERELEAVAGELDRLLHVRETAAAPRRPQKVAASQRPAARSPKRSAPRDNGRLDQVITALEKLDRKVEGLASRPQNDELFDTYEDDLPAYSDHYDEPDTDFDAEDYPDYDSGYDDEDDFDEVYVAPQPPRRRSVPPRAARAPADPGIGVYKDLGRRIDSLRKPQVEAFNMVRQELGSLREAIGGYSNGSQERVGKQNAELRRLSNMIERLRVERQDDRFAKEIRKEVAELKSLVGRTNVDGTLKTLEHGYAHILQRLDELTRATVDPRVLRGVTARLNEIEESFAALPRGEHMLVLEDRIADISDRMEELLHRNSKEEIEPLRTELRDVRSFVEQIDIGGLVESIDDRMKFVSNRLDDIEILAREQRGLDSRLSAMEERLPDADTLDRLQGRLEDIVGMMSDERATPSGSDEFGSMGNKLEEIAGRLDRMERVQPAESHPAAFEALEERLAAISGKIDSIEKKASHPVLVSDDPAVVAAGRVDTEALGELQMRIADLAKQLDKPRDSVTTDDLDALRLEIGEMRKSVAAPASTAALEQRITDLADAVARGSGNFDESRLEQLGSKVAALAEQLENSSHRDEDMARVTTALARIEDGLKATREDVVSIARKAATEAVTAQPGGRSPEYEEAIDGLQSDLKRLLDAAEGAEERTLNTFTGVQSVLGSLTDRLDHLEKTNRAPNASTALEPEESKFLGRGANKWRQVEQAAERPADRVRDRKADFIAAARRAAQAASEEAELLETSKSSSLFGGSSEESRGEARAGWLRKVLKRGSGKQAKEKDESEEADLLLEVPEEKDASQVLPGDRPAPEEEHVGGGTRRRALLFAAAAVVLTIGALQVFRFVSAPGDSATEADKLASATQAPEVAEQIKPDQPVSAAREATGNSSGPVTEAPATQTAESQASPGMSAPAPAANAGQQPVPGDAKQAAVTPPPQGEPASALPATAAAPVSGAVSPDALAFAPPSGAGSSFGKDVPQPDNAIPQPAGDVVKANVVANLPPEAVGPMALRSAAASGNAAAQFLVGVKYTEGSAVTADLSEAAKWYQKAADQGLAPAQYRLASLYEKGRGVERDLAKALKLYTKAAEAGNAKAMHNLAVLYAEGTDGTPDFTKAAKWFESAANYGVKDSLFNLGILYARGLGVEKDLVASYKWFAIAADQGDRDAAAKRDDVANMMDQDKLAAGRLAVETFKLTTPEPAANKVVTDPEWASAQSLSTNASATLGNVVDYKAMVRQAQAKLNQLGFETGTPDGEIGPRTRSAIRAFQRSLGRPETGEVDAGLIKDLDSQSI